MTPRLISALACVIATLGAAGCPTAGVDVDVRDGVDDGFAPGGSANDIDGDGIDNGVDLDVDGDRVANDVDDDIDGDGVDNDDDDTPYGVVVVGPNADADDDGIRNGDDPDDNNDGIPDGVAGQGDCNEDGVVDDENADCDGYCVDIESGFSPCDDGAAPGSGGQDDDGDGVGDDVDADDDGDGVPDGEDNQPGGADPCVGLEGPPPASCIDDPPPPPPIDDDDDGDDDGTDDPPPPGCTQQTFDPTDPVPPRILFLVDRSGSMDEEAPGFPGSKWDATVEALVGPLFGGDGGVVGQLESSVEMGLMTYPAGGDDVCASGELRRTIDIGNHSSIKTALYLTGPEGATPTATSLLEAKGVLDDAGADGGPRALVLATDGGPNCNRSLDGDSCRCVGTRDQCAQFSANCLDDGNTVAAAGALRDAGYPVYVLGISGVDDFADVLTRMAQAGGTGDSIAVSSAQSLASTIEDIAVDVGSCRFELDGLFVDAADLNVTVDGVAVENDPARQNGFDVVGLSTLELFGAACDRARAAKSAIVVENCG
jgi:hypothetical protein